MGARRATAPVDQRNDVGRVCWYIAHHGGCGHQPVTRDVAVHAAGVLDVVGVLVLCMLVALYTSIRKELAGKFWDAERHKPVKW